MLAINNPNVAKFQVPKPLSEEDFEKKWVTSYQPPGGAIDVVTENGLDTVKKTGETRRSVIRQGSVKSLGGKLGEKTRRHSSESSGKRTSFYTPATPAPTATEIHESKSGSADPSQRLSSFGESSKTLLHPSEMDRRQSTRLVKYD